MDVMGAHTSRSGREGVIQFKSVLTPCMPIATCAVQPDQLGASPAAEVTLAPINISRKTDNAATARPATGSGPSWLPPCVMRPHGAPKIKQN